MGAPHWAVLALPGLLVVPEASRCPSFQVAASGAGTHPRPRSSLASLLTPEPSFIPLYFWSELELCL